MSTLPEGRVLIGKIVGAHGVKGTMRVHPLTDYPERFLQMKRLHIERAGRAARELEITGVTSHEGKGQILISAVGVCDRDQAEALAGYLVTIAPDERVELPEGEYWIDSLIGLSVRDAESGAELGRVEDVASLPGHDLYMVRTEQGELKPLPSVAAIVRDVDVDGGVMTVSLPEGLWD